MRLPSNKIVNITTGADVFSSAFTFNGSSTRNDTRFRWRNFNGRHRFELGNDQDTLTLNAVMPWQPW